MQNLFWKWRRLAPFFCMPLPLCPIFIESHCHFATFFYLCATVTCATCFSSCQLLSGLVVLKVVLVPSTVVMSIMSCHTSPVSCPLSYISCCRSSVSSLLSHTSFPHLLSHVSYRTPPVPRLLLHMSCLMFCLTSPVSCILPLLSFLTSPVSSLPC